MFKKSLLLVVSCAMIYADEEAPVPPQVIEKQLSDAEKEFQEAKKMFNPWYAGPLLAPSAHVIPPHSYNIQPYLFFTDTYGQFDKHGNSHALPHHKHQIKPQVVFQFGMFERLDGVVSIPGIRNRQNGHSSTNIGDANASLGFGILKESAYHPAILVSVQETFPTGKYNNLDPKKGGVDATGGGSYQTTINLNFSKVVWWWTTHPMALRLSLGYSIPSSVKVNNFNAYGGAVGTHGTVHPGNSFSADFGYEYSFTQRWVAALDVVYSYSWKTTFSGHATAPMTSPFSDQFSLAPALEYNPSPNLGLLAGVWFTVWGRNSSNFFSEIVSVTYSF